MSLSNLVDLVVKSGLISNGCKIYYEYLENLTNASINNNWRITSGKYKDYHFVIAEDKSVAGKKHIGLTSIYRYKKTLESLGLIAILPKFTTRTNLKYTNYCPKQITVVMQTIPKKLISKLLTRAKNIKNAKILKTCASIISQIKQNFNKAVSNIHTNVKKMLNAVKNTKSNIYTNNSFDNFKNFSNKENTNYSTNNLKNLNSEDVHAVTSVLNKYNIKFKNEEIAQYIELYKISAIRFKNTCRECSNKYMLYPLSYITTVFNTKQKPKNRFCAFPQKEYDWEEMESILIENNKWDLVEKQ